MKKAVRVAITGGIGSGKSYVSQLIGKQYGIPVYNCDNEAKRLNNESEEIRQKITELVGADAYDANGILQKQVLSQYLFANAQNAKHINDIIHPVVARDFEEWVARQTQEIGIVAMECAILFESGFDKLVDCTICVCAPQQLCLERAMQRDKADAEAIRRRMKLQLPDETRSQKSDFVILNDGRELQPQIESIIKQLNNIK